MSGSNEARRLIHELLDGGIGQEDFARLEEILFLDPSARKDYYALMCTDQMLVDTYEMPADLAAHAQRIAQLPVKRKIRFGRVLAAAAALAILGISVTTLVRSNTPRVTMTGSADSHFLIDGKASTSGLWAKGQVLEVRDGMVIARLNEATEACIDGEAVLRLTGNNGDVELRRGKTFFRVAPGAAKFKVRVAGATVRHTGTDFGIRAVDEGSCDIHVLSGSVEISRPSDGTMVLAAGEAASWQDGGATRKTPVDAAAFRQSLPAEGLVFDDDFSEEKGTRMNGKKPDIGRPWAVLGERIPTVAGGGKLDTSGGFRHLKADFLARPESGRGPVVLMSFNTLRPGATSDKKVRLSGIERVTLLDRDAKAICSVVAQARDGHFWRLRDDIAGQESELTTVSALETHQLTLRYDPANKKITLHAGTSPQAETIAGLATEIPAAPAALELWNDYGGDLALSRISVQVVGHPADN